MPYTTNAPPYTFLSPNVVVLINGGGGRYEEGTVTGANIYPGSLVMDDGAGGYTAHATWGGWAETIIAREQALRGIGGAGLDANGNFAGKGLWDYYAVGEQIQLYVAGKGDLLQVLLANGGNATENGLLISDGAGHFTNLPSTANTGGNLYETTAASTALTNTTTETVFSTGSYTIPANYLQAGDILHVRLQGIVTSFNSTDTIAIKLYVGGLTGTAIVAPTAFNGSANDEFMIDAYIEFRTIGNSSAGTMIANGMTNLGTPGTATTRAFLLGSTAVDTTVAETIAVSGKWSVANAGDSCRLDYMTVDLIRQAGQISPLLVCTSAVNNTSGTGTTYPYSPAALVQARVLR